MSYGYPSHMREMARLEETALTELYKRAEAEAIYGEAIPAEPANGNRRQRRAAAARAR